MLSIDPHTRIASAILLLVALACRPDALPRSDSAAALPSSVVAIRSRAHPELVENSGVAMSAAQPGIIFSINDSGNEPLLFAVDTTGADRGMWRVAGATNADWEALAPGPCMGARDTVAPPDPEPRCLYIGDVGDNSADRPSRTIYRVEEPLAREAGFVGEIAALSLTYTYEDSPRDVEAIYVAPDGAIHLISKRPHQDRAERLRPALVFSLAASAWSDSGPAVARLTDSLPIVPGSADRRHITDASLAPDGRHLAVRTYTEVYVFRTDSVTGRVSRDTASAICNIQGLDERQGEGITWYGASERLLLTTEGKHADMHVITCPPPPR